MKNEREFLDDVRHVLDESVNNLDGATRSALTRARYSAQARRARREQRRERWLRRVLAPAAGLAAAVVLMVFALQHGGSGPPEDFVADMEVLGAEESTEFYEDLDFYLWISEEGADEKNIDTTGMFSAYVALLGNGSAGGFAGTAEHGVAGVPGHARG